VRTVRMLAVSAIFALALVGSVTSAFGEAEIGQAAPALIVPELDGPTFDLSALRGKVVVVNFWATWCPPCRKEMPTLNAFYQRYHSSGLEMIGISADRPHDQKDVETTKQSLAYPIAMLNDAKDNGFGDPSSIPITYIIDGTGVVRARLLPGEDGVSESELSAAVLPLLPHANTADTSASGLHTPN
jgi:cytochrome c biogenesis protein CcmG, thiol:disulfide interchange protein DsbE